MIEDVAFFRTQGYLVVPSAAPNGATESILGFADSATIPSRYLTLDDQGRRVRVEGMLQNTELASVLRSARVLWLALRRQLGQNWSALANRHNHVTTNAGGDIRAARMHRDSLHWSRGYLTVVLMLNGVDSPQSFTSVIPGSHLWPDAGPPNGGGYWLDEGPYAPLSHQAVAVSARNGDALLLDPLVFHRAGHGTSEDPRSVLTLAVAAVDELAARPADHEILLEGHHDYQGQVTWRQDG